MEIIGLNDALRYLDRRGVVISPHQGRNWFGSGKLPADTTKGEPAFDTANLDVVAERWLKSNGRQYSIYEPVPTGGFVEVVNTAQCAEMWSCCRRQAQKEISEQRVPGKRIGNEFFVPLDAATKHQIRSVREPQRSHRHEAWIILNFQDVKTEEDFNQVLRGLDGFAAPCITTPI
jgi:hypothetical protein